MRILIVEDDFVARRLLQKLLDSFGDVDIAVDGEEALAAYSLALQENSPYNLILLDILMPKMDGREALRRIRQIEAQKGITGLARVKAVMTTALSDGGNVVGSFFQEECDGYVTKPYCAERIYEELKRLGLTQ